LDYQEILRYFNGVIKDKTDYSQLFCALHNVFVSTIQTNFTALGVYQKPSNCINLRLMDKIGATYTSKIMLNNNENLIAKAFLEKKIQVSPNISPLNLLYLENSMMAILPLSSFNENLGVLAIGDNSVDAHLDFYELVSNYMASFMRNCSLGELVEKNTDIDLLTGLANHKSLQEKITKQIKIAQENKQKLAICLFDIANISQINRELGHAKGDEVIRTVAQKISQSTTNTTFCGRYGGDEIAVIMPNTSTKDAKYIVEYLIYTLSCVNIDDVGPIKVSAGIATYPDISCDQEKLLILAEQAMCISKSKSYENGNCVVVTAEDIDFWEDGALKSFAEVLMKRHAQVGVNFEDDLIEKFHNEKIISSQHLLEVVTSLASTIDAKDTYTKGHSTFVSRYSEALARAINLPEADVERIRLGALLHDIGKIGIPENVLRKPTVLNDEEWEVMKQHPAIGADKVLAPNESLRDLIPMVKFHHEHYDGTGYPFGLKGEEIPLSARIVSIADAYHALVSDRPYRQGLSVKKACEILRLGAGIQWDRELVRQFVNIAPSLSTSV
jgi:diguanylate cyclase (GGDEF)-like protein/putative nucleotidyltransferase with HDIG domain